MSADRRIKKVFKSRPFIEGAGVHLKRAFGFNEVPQLDPFLLLDDFHSQHPEHYLKGFPWHPHRGIETITYVLEGKVEHGDSLGNQGVIGPGDVQWMTAGSGVIHQEMPQGDEEKHLWGFQLWANLPAAQKMMAPRYREVTRQQIPVAELPDGVRAAVICGEIAGVKGPVQDIVIEPQYLDVSVPAGVECRLPAPTGHTALAYVIQGRGAFCAEMEPFSYQRLGQGWFELEQDPILAAETLLLFEDGDQVLVSTRESPLRFLFITGKPLGEPVAWYGPIVMNTQQELQKAFEEYANGTFLK